MKIAVCLKQTPATTANIRVRDSADGLELSGVEMVVNPYDEYALEQALQVRDAVGGSEIIAVSVGGDDAAKILHLLEASDHVDTDSLILEQIVPHPENREASALASIIS